jgi:hypothetical protein
MQTPPSPRASLGNVIKIMYKFSAPVPTLYSIIRYIFACGALYLCSNFVFKCTTALRWIIPSGCIFPHSSLAVAALCGGALNDEYFALIRKLFHPCSLHIWWCAVAAASNRVPGEFLFLCARRDFAANYCNKNLSIRDITCADVLTHQECSLWCRMCANAFELFSEREHASHVIMDAREMR